MDVSRGIDPSIFFYIFFLVFFFQSFSNTYNYSGFIEMEPKEILPHNFMKIFLGQTKVPQTSKSANLIQYHSTPFADDVFIFVLFVIRAGQPIDHVVFRELYFIIPRLKTLHC